MTRALGAARESENTLMHRLFVRLSVAKMRTKNVIFSKTKQFRAMVSIDDL